MGLTHGLSKICNHITNQHIDSLTSLIKKVRKNEHQEDLVMKNLYERAIDYVLKLEWCANLVDGNGQRCAECYVIYDMGQGEHDLHCVLGKLCRDIRLVNKAKELVG